MQNAIFLLFVFCILLTCFVLNPKEKIRDYIFNVNKINYLKVYCNDDNLINKLKNNENITEIVYPYKDNISTYKGELPSIDSVISKNNQVSENVMKTAVYGTLPMNYQCVSVDLSDLYGSYFKNKRYNIRI